MMNNKLNDGIDCLFDEIIQWKLKNLSGDWSTPKTIERYKRRLINLIVEECAQICKTVGAERVSNADEKYQLGREMGAEVCHNTIKHHFGIKDE